MKKFKNFQNEVQSYRFLIAGAIKSNIKNKLSRHSAIFVILIVLFEASSFSAEQQNRDPYAEYSHKSIPELQNLATNGDDKAQVLLGQLYRVGGDSRFSTRGIRQNPALAEKLFKAAAKKKNVDAMMGMASMLSGGYGRKDEAIAWLHIANLYSNNKYLGEELSVIKGSSKNSYSKIDYSKIDQKVKDLMNEIDPNANMIPVESYLMDASNPNTPIIQELKEKFPVDNDLGNDSINFLNKNQLNNSYVFQKLDLKTGDIYMAVLQGPNQHIFMHWKAPAPPSSNNNEMITANWNQILNKWKNKVVVDLNWGNNVNWKIDYMINDLVLQKLKDYIPKYKEWCNEAESSNSPPIIRIFPSEDESNPENGTKQNPIFAFKWDGTGGSIILRVKQWNGSTNEYVDEVFIDQKLMPVFEKALPVAEKMFKCLDNPSDLSTTSQSTDSSIKQSELKVVSNEQSQTVTTAKNEKRDIASNQGGNSESITRDQVIQVDKELNQLYDLIVKHNPNNNLVNEVKQSERKWVKDKDAAIKANPASQNEIEYRMTVERVKYLKENYEKQTVRSLFPGGSVFGEN